MGGTPMLRGFCSLENQTAQRNLDRPDGTFFPCYDGNANITGYVDGSGNIRAHYGYSPFGETTVQSGDLAHTFRFRFSTEYWDEETRS